MTTIKKTFLCAFMSLCLVLIASPLWGTSKADDEQTIRNATAVLQAMVANNNAPASVLKRADCLIILPSVKKFAVGIGGTGGRGPMICRTGKDFSGKWGPPAMFSIGGASAGFQIGGTASDYIIAVMSPAAVSRVLNAKVKIGSDISAAAGPGASAGTSMSSADMLTYGRSSGLFAGVSLDGASLSPDSNANRRLYGRSFAAADIVAGETVKPTSAGQSLVDLLNAKGGKHE